MLTYEDMIQLGKSNQQTEMDETYYFQYSFLMRSMSEMFCFKRHLLRIFSTQNRNEIIVGKGNVSVDHGFGTVVWGCGDRIDNGMAAGLT